MRIQVESSTNHDGMPIPRRFRLDGSRIDVVETLDQWHGPDYRYVKVKCDNGGLYILRFDESRGAWDLTMFQSERCRRALCWNSMWRNLQRHEVIVSGGEVNWLIDGRCGERLPAIDLAHVDLTGGEQGPEQHGGSLC